MTKRFKGELKAAGRGGHHVTLDEGVVRALDGKAHTRVKGTINGTPYRSSIFPYGGVYYLGVHKATVAAARVKPGDIVAVVIERDDAPRTVETPHDLRKALDRRAGLTASWDAMSYSHRKEYVGWIEEAKKPETRERRIAKTVKALAESTRPKR